EILLEVKGLNLVLGDDHLDVGNPLRQLPNRSPAVRALLKVRPNPRPQGLGFAHVKHIPTAIAKQVNPRPSGQGLQLILKPRRHFSSLAPSTHHKTKPEAKPGEAGLDGGEPMRRGD